MYATFGDAVFGFSVPLSVECKLTTNFIARQCKVCGVAKELGKLDAQPCLQIALLTCHDELQSAELTVNQLTDSRYTPTRMNLEI